MYFHFTKQFSVKMKEQKMRKGIVNFAFVHAMDFYRSIFRENEMTLQNQEVSSSTSTLTRQSFIFWEWNIITNFLFEIQCLTIHDDKKLCHPGWQDKVSSSEVETLWWIFCLKFGVLPYRMTRQSFSIHYDETILFEFSIYLLNRKKLTKLRSIRQSC